MVGVAWGLMGSEVPRDHTALSSALELKAQKGLSWSPAEKPWGMGNGTRQGPGVAPPSFPGAELAQASHP